MPSDARWAEEARRPCPACGLENADGKVRSVRHYIECPGGGAWAELGPEPVAWGCMETQLPVPLQVTEPPDPPGEHHHFVATIRGPERAPCKGVLVPLYAVPPAGARCENCQCHVWYGYKERQAEREAIAAHLRADKVSSRNHIATLVERGDFAPVVGA